jgi:hypothetical protein
MSAMCSPSVVSIFATCAFAGGQGGRANVATCAAIAGMRRGPTQFSGGADLRSLFGFLVKGCFEFLSRLSRRVVHRTAARLVLLADDGAQKPVVAFSSIAPMMLAGHAGCRGRCDTSQWPRQEYRLHAV